MSPDVSIHPTAVVESDAIGAGTDIGPFVHVMAGAVVGRNCNVCAHATLDENCVIEDDVTILNAAYIAEGVHLGRGVFVGPGAVFTNDRMPRSPRFAPFAERYRDKDSWLVRTEVGEGASIGANATIVCGNSIGKYAVVAAGAVVTKPVPDYALVAGVPARVVRVLTEAER